MFSFALTPPTLEKFDLGGVLYHANYFHLFEQAREKFLEQQANLPYPQLVKLGHHLAIAEAQIKFISPVFYGDKLNITLSASKLRKSSLILHYQIHNAETCLLLTSANTKLAFVSKTQGGFKPDRMPEELYKAFEGIKVAE